MSLKFGVWAPVCGGWLRTRGGGQDARPTHSLSVARRGDQLGYDYLYVPEHHLNAVYGPERGVADGWVVSSAAAALTRQIRVITAVQPGFKHPSVVAKMGATIASLRSRSFGLSVLAGWWRLEAESYGDSWLPHAERYARAGEFLDVIRGLWSEPSFTYSGRYYRTDETELQPKPAAAPPVFIAGESDSAIDLAARAGDTLFINGDVPERVAELTTSAKRHARERYGRALKVAVSAFSVLEDSDAAARATVQRIAQDADHDLIDYFNTQIDGSVVAHNRGASAERVEANLGLSAGLIGAADRQLAQLAAFEDAGVDAVLVKFERSQSGMERFAKEVLHPYRRRRELGATNPSAYEQVTTETAAAGN